MAWNSALTDLQEVLAYLYDTQADAHTFVDGVGLAHARIAYDAEALHTWHAILDEALKQNQIEAVLQTALKEYPRNAPLRDAAAAYRQSVGGRAARVGLEPETRQGNLCIRHEKPARIFVSYQRDIDPDVRLAGYLHAFLTKQGHQVFIDRDLFVGDVWHAWLDKIDQQIQASDFLVLLLSKKSAESEMLRNEVMRACAYQKRNGRPRILPVRIAYEDMVPYSIAFLLGPLQYIEWSDESSSERVGRGILAAVEHRMPDRLIVDITPAPGAQFLSEDGRPIAAANTLHPPLTETDPCYLENHQLPSMLPYSKDDRPIGVADGLHLPLPEFDPRYLENLEVPGGTARLSDRMYIERVADVRLKGLITQPGQTIHIRAPRQTGKSSLMVRGLQCAREHQANIVYLDLQPLEAGRLDSPDVLLHDLGQLMLRKLRLDVDLEKLWLAPQGSQIKLTSLLEDHVLPELERPLVLALDEVDRLLTRPYYKDFFSLLRSWHNNRAMDEQWNRMSIVMAISSEPYLLIDDLARSPFNVGTAISLEDLYPAQVDELNRRHGAPLTQKQLPDLVNLLDGHPYLTRKALYMLVVEKMAWPELLSIAPMDQGPFGDHLRSQAWHLRHYPELVEALANVIRRSRCPDDRAFERLLRAGLVKGSGDICRCRCDLYRQYFEGKLR